MPPPEIDAHTSGEVRQLLAACDPRGVTIVDFSAVTLCGAAGIHTLLEAQARHVQAGGRLLVHRASPAVRRVFALTHTTELLADELRLTGRSLPLT